MQATAQAQDKVPAGNFALVNTTPLPNSLLEQVLQNNAMQGFKETPETRNLVRSELIVRVALGQEAVKLGLDKQEKTMTQLELLKQNLLAEMLFDDHLTKNTITETTVRADFDRQLTLLKDAKEYKIRTIVLADEASAKAVLANVRKGEAFEKIAKENSIDVSKSQAGDLGWLLAEQIDPLVANVLVNLSKGGVAAAPIKVQNTWHLIKLEDIRNFSPPKFEDAKNQIRQALLNKQKNEFINKVLSNTKIQLADQ
jgi:peptidyl-prolyl cis-trans isomerase C